jgi:hypothetical protein
LRQDCYLSLSKISPKPARDAMMTCLSSRIYPRGPHNSPLEPTPEYASTPMESDATYRDRRHVYPTCLPHFVDCCTEPLSHWGSFSIGPAPLLAAFGLCSASSFPPVVAPQIKPLHALFSRSSPPLPLHDGHVTCPHLYDILVYKVWRVTPLI